MQNATGEETLRRDQERGLETAPQDLLSGIPGLICVDMKDNLEEQTNPCGHMA